MTQDYYNKIASSYNKLHGEEQINKAKLILKEFLKHKKKGLLLDIGGGTGISTELFTENFECVLIDPSEKLLEQGPPHIVKLLTSAETLPFSQNKFDLITSLTALHHTNMKQSLEEIKRVSKNGTLVAISFLKNSQKLEEFKKLFYKQYSNAREIEQEKDIIFFNF
tara:strand:+ start:1586 stop:2083 length:498 start_codon:yes stop_codon:yes gene_type:complete